MKNKLIKISLLSLTISTVFTACKKDPEDLPVPVEQELITTMKLYVTDSSGFSDTFIYKVENGFGSTQGTIKIDTIRLAPAKTYFVTTELFNEKASPVENITEEVIDEKDAHLFLYRSEPLTGAGSLSFSDGSRDNQNLPFNQTIRFTTGAAGSGKITVDLIHEPVNKNGSTPDVSGGETDAQAVYPVLIQ